MKPVHTRLRVFLILFLGLVLSGIARDFLLKDGDRVAFLTPQPIEEKRPDPDKDVRNESLRKFADGLKEVCSREGATFVDQFDPYMAITMKERASNPSVVIGGGDAVHPGPIGHTQQPD